MRTDHLFEKYYFSRPEFVDGTTEFHHLVASCIRSGSSILEIGAGPTNETTSYLATLGPVTGIDISGEVETNAALSESRVFDGSHFPFSDGKFDVCISNWVIEHLHDPSNHLHEVARVLKRDGLYCFRTPNQWHYFTLGSKLLPFSMHAWITKKLRGLSAEAHDPYPAYYRANTPPRIRQLGKQSGLTTATLFAIEKEPSYGRFHPILFYPMFVYERLVNSCDRLQVFRASLLGVLRKPESLARDRSIDPEFRSSPKASRQPCVEKTNQHCVGIQ